MSDPSGFDDPFFASSTTVRLYTTSWTLSICYLLCLEAQEAQEASEE